MEPFSAALSPCSALPCSTPRSIVSRSDHTPRPMQVSLLSKRRGSDTFQVGFVSRRLLPFGPIDQLTEGPLPPRQAWRRYSLSCPRLSSPSTRKSDPSVLTCSPKVRVERLAPETGTGEIPPVPFSYQTHALLLALGKQRPADPTPLTRHAAHEKNGARVRAVDGKGLEYRPDQNRKKHTPKNQTRQRGVSMTPPLRCSTPQIHFSENFIIVPARSL